MANVRPAWALVRLPQDNKLKGLGTGLRDRAQLGSIPCTGKKKKKAQDQMALLVNSSKLKQ